MRRGWLSQLFPSLFALLLALFLFWPLLESVRGAFFDAHDTASVGYVLGVFRNPVLVEGFGNVRAGQLDVRHAQVEGFAADAVDGRRAVQRRHGVVVQAAQQTEQRRLRRGVAVDHENSLPHRCPWHRSAPPPP